MGRIRGLFPKLSLRGFLYATLRKSPLIRPIRPSWEFGKFARRIDRLASRIPLKAPRCTPERTKPSAATRSRFPHAPAAGTRPPRAVDPPPYRARLLNGRPNPEGPGDGVFAALPRVLRTGPERARAPDDPGLDRGGEGGERPGLDRGEELDVPAAL